MANSILTIDMITRRALMLFLNSNAFIGQIPKQYDDFYAKTGAKIGDTLRIRLPNDFVVSDGPALSVQDTSEQSVSMTVATQRHVDTSFNSADLTLKLDDYSERITAPKMNVLAGNVASTIMSGVEGGICNLVSNTNSSGAIIAPTSETWLDAGAVLTNNSSDIADRKAVLNPRTMARTVSSLSGLFNPAPEISRQYKSARIYDALNFEWFEDQTVINHTSGTFTAGTVSTANQTGSTLAVNAITGTLKKGDIITLELVNAVNRVTKQTTGELRQFVVLADVADGGTSIPIYPSLIPAASDGSAVQYQTVDVSPAANAAITLATPANTTYRKNFVFAKECVTMVTADLVMPTGGVISATRARKDGVSMRSITAYVPGTDQTANRLDVLFGFKFLRPEWGVFVCDAV